MDRSLFRRGPWPLPASPAASLAKLEHRPEAVVLLGDMDLERPLADELKQVVDAGVRLLWIPGNHDGDRETWLSNLFGGASAAWSIHGRVETIGQLRIAGLGGVFREQVWHPGMVTAAPPSARGARCCRASARAERSRNSAPKWERQPGIPMRHRVSIWPEDYDRLAASGANILATHEAPSCCVSSKGRKMGLEEIDVLGEALGVRAIFHGHHHIDYDTVLPNNIRVFGVGRAGVRADDGTIIRPGLGRGQT